MAAKKMKLIILPIIQNSKKINLKDQSKNVIIDSYK